ncbi:BMP family ABC transporter substrate-binding protein [Herbiconiux sp. VKM Ac-1786]|uniref:BMP family ABC transporter substrate-binding protein n=1 Tax=Herbiconiux sp. VKM Ac-1786 TaxID=2783824 RepID=UPI00188A9274|nr:BMP family ABC transporter substrate-binding protein [Herbiconiux sp. VKM Ac-1786]MBF4571096.1 BMP family ABC transporter substrate-binding protein [Herbiconiux sp. VKM Ac-1786]
MSKFARRAGAAALAVGLIASVAACSSGGSGSGSGDSTGASGDESIILITPTPIGSNNFLQLAADGAEQAGEKYGASVDVYESEDPTSIQQNIDAAVREKPSIIIGVSFSVLDQITQAAADYPDQQFLLIDTSAEEPTENLTSAVFKEYEATYLTGVEAGLLTQSGNVGVVASLDTPFLHRWVDPFFAGAESVKPGVKTAVQYVGGDNPFGDQARSKAQAQILADGGADYVQAAASGGNLGVFEAASEAGFKAFGVDTNQCLDSPGNVVDNAIKRVDVALVNSVGDILDGTTGGFTSYGLAEGGVSLTGLEDGVADSQCLIADHPDVIEKVAAVRDQIVSGEITVTDPLTAG